VLGAMSDDGFEIGRGLVPARRRDGGLRCGARPRRARDRRGDGTVALVLGAVAAASVLGARRLGLAGRLAVVGRLVVPAALVIGTVVGAWVTIDEVSQILG